MITSPVGTVLKHRSGAIAIITKVDGTRVWGVYSDEACKHPQVKPGDKPLHTELLTSGWIAISKFVELNAQQITAYLNCLGVAKDFVFVRVLNFYEIPQQPYDYNRSDGSTASYYQLPEGAKELQDLISHRNMNAQLGEIFRACYRFGMASHSDQLRDAKKIKFYIEAEIKRLEANGNTYTTSQ